MTDLWQTLKSKNKPIVIYGMGNGADAVIDKLSSIGVDISGVFASDDFVRGQTFRGHTVKTLSDIETQLDDFIVVTAFGSTLGSVRENIIRISKRHELYIADAPVYGKTFFDSGFVQAHKLILEKVYSSLSDKRSKHVFENIVKFKLSGKIEYLFASEDSEESTFKELLPNRADTIFDLGAFIGDTAEKFATLWPDYKKIIAVEPSEKNFSRLLKTAEHLRNTECVNAAIGYLNGNMFFGDEGGRNQSLHGGSKSTTCITIDKLCEKFGFPSFIKFDIEGEELNGIIGGEQTIKNHKPVLLVSAYHRSEDLITIPQKILSLRDDYKMFLRRFPCIPCWDTYYIFV